MLLDETESADITKMLIEHGAAVFSPMTNDYEVDDDDEDDEEEVVDDDDNYTYIKSKCLIVYILISLFIPKTVQSPFPPHLL